MNRYVTLAWLLVLPLILIVGVTFAIYGLERPPDNTRADVIGKIYGAYAVVAFLFWYRKRHSQNFMDITNTKKRSPIVTAVAVAVGSVVGYTVVHQYFNQPPNIDQALVTTANQTNKTLPMMVDKETRLDATMAAPNKTFVYHYTLVNLNAADVPKDRLITVLRPKVLANYKTNPGLNSFRNNGVTMDYQYSDKSGVFVGEFTVGPKDL